VKALLGYDTNEDGDPVGESDQIIAARVAAEGYKAAGLEGDPGVSENVRVQGSGAGVNPDHEYTAMFILQQKGMNSDLSTYKSVDVLTMKRPDGSEIFVIVLDGKQAVVPGGK